MRVPERGATEAGTQLVFLLRRPTFAARRVPPSQISGLPVFPPFAPVMHWGVGVRASWCWGQSFISH